MRPNVGLIPTTPLNDAGRSTDPAVCDPSAAGNIRADTPTAEPGTGAARRAPGVPRVDSGGGSPLANSVVTVLPKIIAPARRSLATAVES